MVDLSTTELSRAIDVLITKVVPLAPDPQLAADFAQVAKAIVMDLRRLADYQERLAILKARQMGIGAPG